MADTPIAQPDDKKEDGNDEGDFVMHCNEYNNNIPSEPKGKLLPPGSAPAEPTATRS